VKAEIKCQLFFEFSHDQFRISFQWVSELQIKYLLSFQFFQLKMLKKYNHKDVFTYD